MIWSYDRALKQTPAVEIVLSALYSKCFCSVWILNDELYGKIEESEIVIFK